MAGKRKRVHAGEKERDPLQPTSYSFFEDVYAVVRMIPPGRVTSYGAIAAYLGTRMSARMVGWAMNASHSTTPPVPAHRVVNRNGQLSGKANFGSANEMQTRLEMEGIQVKEDQVVDFKSIFWDPKQALEFN